MLYIEGVLTKNTAWKLEDLVVFATKKLVLSPGHSPNGTELKNNFYISVISITNHHQLAYFHLIVINLIVIS